MGHRFKSCRALQDFKAVSRFRQGRFGTPDNPNKSGSKFCAVAVALLDFNLSRNHHPDDLLVSLLLIG